MTNQVIDAVKSRRSIRTFKDVAVDKETLEKIIQAGRYAPSAKDDQPWRFIVITNRDKIASLSQQVKNELKKILKRRFFLKIFYKELRKKETLMSLYGASMTSKDVIFFNAPALIFVVAKKKQFYDESCACCAQNMMLAAHSLGIGSCWVGFAHFLNLNKKALRELQVPEGYHISAVLVFGHPTGRVSKAPMRKPMADIINWIE